MKTLITILLIFSSAVLAGQEDTISPLEQETVYNALESLDSKLSPVYIEGKPISLLLDSPRELHKFILELRENQNVTVTYAPAKARGDSLTTHVLMDHVNVRGLCPQPEVLYI